MLPVISLQSIPCELAWSTSLTYRSIQTRQRPTRAIWGQHAVILPHFLDFIRVRVGSAINSDWNLLSINLLLALLKTEVDSFCQ